jgi:hypothetical protein
MLSKKHAKILHVMTSVKYHEKEVYDLVDSWNDIARYVKEHPMVRHP